MFKFVETISCGEGRKLVKPLILTTLTDFVSLIPFIGIAGIVLSIFDVVSGDEVNAALLWICCALLALLFIVTLLLERVSLVASFTDGYHVSAQSRTKLAEHIRKLPLGFLNRTGQASLTNSMMADIAVTEQAMTHALPQMISGFAVALLSTLALAVFDWRMALAAFAGLPVALLILAIGRTMRKRADEELTQAQVNQSADLQDFLYGIAYVKSCDGGELVVDRVRASCEAHRDSCLHRERTIGTCNNLASAFLQIGLPLIVVTSVYLLSIQDVPLSTAIIFLIVGTRIFDPLAAAIMNLSQIESAQNAGSRVLSLLNENALPGTADIPSAQDISFENVSFAYNDSPVLHNVSTELKPKTITALVGPSGSGKSTMLNLAARFYDPSHGSIFMGGKNIKTCDPEKLYRHVSVVFQDVYLFQDSLENNIRYGKEDATPEEVIQAAKAARCHNFICEKPEGYLTMVGEGGSTLSGGERQRIAIARALLKDAPIVLLDEATSALDAENEREVQQALTALVHNKTIMVIAHQLNTVKHADQILVMNHGTIVEQGKHADLIDNKGLYASLYRTQTEVNAWNITQEKDAF